MAPSVSMLPQLAARPLRNLLLNPPKMDRANLCAVANAKDQAIYPSFGLTHTLLNPSTLVSELHPPAYWKAYWKACGETITLYLVLSRAHPGRDP
eukprot:3887969-Pyramimonas_sp.AAC.2